MIDWNSSTITKRYEIVMGSKKAKDELDTSQDVVFDGYAPDIMECASYVRYAYPELKLKKIELMEILIYEEVV